MREDMSDCAAIGSRRMSTIGPVAFQVFTVGGFVPDMDNTDVALDQS
jgi:hypothetical protein